MRFRCLASCGHAAVRRASPFIAHTMRHTEVTNTLSHKKSHFDTVSQATQAGNYATLMCAKGYRTRAAWLLTASPNCPTASPPPQRDPKPSTRTQHHKQSPSNSMTVRERSTVEKAILPLPSPHQPLDHTYASSEAAIIEIPEIRIILSKESHS